MRRERERKSQDCKPPSAFCAVPVVCMHEVGPKASTRAAVAYSETPHPLINLKKKGRQEEKRNKRDTWGCTSRLRAGRGCACGTKLLPRSRSASRAGTSKARISPGIV
eukprot:1857547-Rhodomonas_salina.1